MKDIVSIVIPVYNVEKYLRECLDSIVGQTYANLQIILVDDGSTDASGQICDEYANRDKRITVVHQENQGAGAAKNTGLDLVKGKYLSLIDSDDYIEKNFYEIMIKTMERYRADIVQCLLDNVYVNKVYKRNYHFPSSKMRKMRPQRFLFETLYDWKYAIFANKVFRAELLGKTRFPVGRKIDDEFFTYKLVCEAKAVVNINEYLYHYRMRKSSVVNNNKSEQMDADRLICFEERYHYVRKKYPKLERIYYKHLSQNCGEKYMLKQDTLFEKIKYRINLARYLYDEKPDTVGEYYE